MPPRRILLFVSSFALFLPLTSEAQRCTGAVHASKPAPPARTLIVNGTPVEGKLIKIGTGYYVSLDDLARALGGSLGYSQISVSLSLPQQQQTSTPPTAVAEPTTHAVGGKVFAVTNGGELKVARFAKVALLQGAAIDAFKQGGFYDSRPDIAKSQALGLSGPSIELMELEAIQAMQKLYLRLEEVRKRNPQLVTSVDADEEGKFQFKDMKPGKYTVVAFGRAGQNAAMWLEEVEVLPNALTEDLKLRDPKTAVSDPRGYVQY
jgi:hypothetical protein